MSNASRIPPSVEQSILSWHQDMKAKYGHGMPDPEWLRMGLSFWTIEDDEELAMFLTEDLVSALFSQDLSDLPRGYTPLIRLLEFERHRAFEGWTAVPNKGEDEMRLIIGDYRAVGLVQEASALEAVLAAYLGLPENEERLSPILAAAYGSVPNDTRDIDERIPTLLQYVRANPDSFAASAV